MEQPSSSTEEKTRIAAQEAIRLKELAETTAMQLMTIASSEADRQRAVSAAEAADRLRDIAEVQAEKLKVVAENEAIALTGLEQTEAEKIIAAKVKSIAAVAAVKLKQVAESAAQELRELTSKTTAKTKQLQLFLDNAMFQAIFDSINDGIIVTDSSGKVLFNNRAALAITGLHSLKDNDPSQFAQYYNFFKPDKESPWPASQDPLARAMRGKTTIGELMYVKATDVEKGASGGKFISCMAVPLSYSASVNNEKHDTVVGGIMMFRRVQELSDRY
jgi:PAS domain-containing protein